MRKILVHFSLKLIEKKFFYFFFLYEKKITCIFYSSCSVELNDKTKTYFESLYYCYCRYRNKKKSSKQIIVCIWLVITAHDVTTDVREIKAYNLVFSMILILHNNVFLWEKYFPFVFFCVKPKFYRHNTCVYTIYMYLKYRFFK